MLPALAHIDTWIFDLDNTLYPASAGIFPLIDVRMGAYVAKLLKLDPDEAHRIQKKYFHEHGTTLSGLMARHEVDPYHFLEFVHDIDMRSIAPNSRLAGLLARLPGRKLVFTNGDAPYALKILAALGLGNCFEAIFDIHDQGYLPKPAPASYDRMCKELSVTPSRAAFFEDMARNLKPAKALGMATIWINNGSEAGHLDAHPSYIDYEISEPTYWLETILEKNA